MKKCMALQSAQMLCVTGDCPHLSNSFGDEYWVFSAYSLAKAPSLGAQTLVNAKSKRSQVLVFWGDGHWFDGYLCLSLQPPQLSDAVISMVTQTPRLLTAACEEQHSAAQGSHDQVSQKESPSKSSPPVCHSLSCQVFPCWSHPGSQVLCTYVVMDSYLCCHLRLWQSSSLEQRRLTKSLHLFRVGF